MSNPANDIFHQATQGSVAAIIQVLNDKLESEGVRTRAMFDGGVLQLLCEGRTIAQLEKDTLLAQVQQILEAIAPKTIRRVKVNARLVDEQQILWLDEIKRNPEQLVWSEEITLKKPNLVEQWQRDREIQSKLAVELPKKTVRQQREEQLVQRGGLIGAGTVALLGVGGWLAYSQFAQPKPDTSAQQAPGKTAAAKPVESHASANSQDPFTAAVKLAEQTSTATKTAKTSADWLALAAKWREASEMMAKVPNSHTKYAIAQDRMVAYRKNSESAVQKSQQ